MSNENAGAEVDALKQRAEAAESRAQAAEGKIEDQRIADVRAKASSAAGLSPEDAATLKGTDEASAEAEAREVAGKRLDEQIEEAYKSGRTAEGIRLKRQKAGLG